MPVLPQTRNLTEAILDSGIQNTNFFNGRILNAGDLQTDQEANRQQHEQLGLAVGAAVVQGLWVELVNAGTGAAAPIVSVTRGLAFNANGQAVALPIDVQVALTRVTTPLPVDAGLFTDCAPPSTTTVPLQAGVYILVATPASGYSGQAPMYSFGDVNSATGCGSRYAVEGIRFRLVQLDMSKLTRLSQATQTAIAQLMTQTDAASLSRLRNWIAHICFGTEEVSGSLVDPFPPANKQSPYLTYGAIDALTVPTATTVTPSVAASGYLTSCDVPLALLYWTNQGVQFLDRWSVRRPLTQGSITQQWPLLFSDRRRSEAEAMVLQFEDQVQSIIANETNLASVAADSHFIYLPPAGLLPITGHGISAVTGSPATRAFDMPGFFAAHASQDIATTDGGLLRELFATALDYEPIQLAQTGAIQLYLVWENLKAVNGGVTAQLALIFASPAMRYQGIARFGAAKWSLSRFAPRVI
jgi:hypothetical protein